MLECIKRQKVVTRSTGCTVLRCINKECEAYGNEVSEECCAMCPVRATRNVRPCKGGVQAPKPVTTPAPSKTESAEIIEMIKASPLRDVEEFSELTATEPADPSSPDYPKMSMQLWLYKEALIRWNKAGRPTRSDEEVAEIHEKKCKPCPWYDSEKQRCKGCGCKVTTGAVAVFNKIKMKTEKCPRGEWE